MDASNQEQKTISFSQKLHAGAQKLWQQMTVEQRWYFLAFAFPSIILIYNQLPDFLPKQPQAKEAAFTAFLILSTIGIFQYLSKLAHKISNNILLKSIFTAIFVAGATVALSYADSLINETLKVPSGPFNYTQTITSLLLIPIFIAFIAIALSVISVFLITFSPSITTFKLYEKEDEQRYQVPTIFLRCGILIFFGVLAEKSLTQSEGYQKFVTDVIQDYAYNMEMEQYTHCDQSDGERFAYIDANTVVVAIKHGETYSFKVRACKESIAEGVSRSVDEKTKGLLKDILRHLK